MSQQIPDESPKDIFRDTPVRFLDNIYNSEFPGFGKELTRLGYANEVGEAFRQLVSTKLVKFSYVIASTYCLSDATSKAFKVLDQNDESVSTKSVNHRALEMFIEAALWQGLASVIIPGFTINRICWLSSKILSRSSLVSKTQQKWLTTSIGLTSIPVIIKPIDNLVDNIMEVGIDFSNKIGFKHEIVHDEKLHVAFDHDAKFKE